MEMRRLLLVPALMCALEACRPNDRQLVDRYRLVRIYDTAVAIADGTEEIVVPADIDGLSQVGVLLVGHATDQGLSPSAARDAVPGYFIIDVKSRKLKSGLSKEEWLRELALRGVNGEPQLGKPRID
jgi:hypothetical protein